MFKQTFWNNFINPTTLSTFVGWVKDSEAESKIYIYNYLQNRLNKHKSIIDLGCGTGTIYDGLKQRNINIKYTGVDSCVFFINNLTSRNIEVINSDIRNVSVINDSSYDIAFGRHVLEHQDNFYDLLNELIRLGKNEATHIFFIKPSNETEDVISFDKKSNLYHNTYSKFKIENFLKNHKKVDTFKWVDINDKETILHMYLH